MPPPLTIRVANSAILQPSRRRCTGEIIAVLAGVIRVRMTPPASKAPGRATVRSLRTFAAGLSAGFADPEPTHGPSNTKGDEGPKTRDAGGYDAHGGFGGCPDR